MELSLFTKLVICLVILIHIAAAYFEMYQFPWFAKRAAGIDAPHAEACRVVGWNQGLYNLFFVVGLLVSLFIEPGPESLTLQIFCLASLAMAGLGGWYSMNNYKVAVGQTVPSGLVLAMMAFGWA